MNDIEKKVDDPSKLPIKTIWGSLELEAEELYKYVLTIASAFSGGTWFFMDKITMEPIHNSLILLFIGWGGLLFSIAILPIVRLFNLAGGRSVLEQKPQLTEKYSCVNDRLTWLMVLSMILGMVFIAIYIGVNLWYKSM